MEAKHTAFILSRTVYIVMLKRCDDKRLYHINTLFTSDSLVLTSLAVHPHAVAEYPDAIGRFLLHVLRNE